MTVPVNITPLSAQAAKLIPHTSIATLMLRALSPAGDPLLLSKRLRKISRDQHLFLADEVFRSCYLIRTGTVKVYFSCNDGEEQVVDFALPGEIIGLEAADSGYYPYSAVALENCGICVVSCQQLMQLQPDSWHDLYTDAIAKNYSALEILSKKGADQRLASFLLNLSGRLGKRGHYKSRYYLLEFNLSMSRRDIGDYLGLALETVSRLFSQLETQGLLQVRCRRVRIMNFAGLRRLAGGSTEPYQYHLWRTPL